MCIHSLVALVIQDDRTTKPSVQIGRVHARTSICNSLFTGRFTVS
jgi:hypothetical protein